MTTAPIVPTAIDFDRSAEPRAAGSDQRRHANAPALERAAQEFLHRHGLPARWAGRRRFVVLETGIDLGHNFLATWAAWRADPQRCAQLVYIATEFHPPPAADLARAHAGSSLAGLALELVAAWPPLTPNIHTLDFDCGHVRLLLGLGDADGLLAQLSARVDAVYLDRLASAGQPAPAGRRLFKAIARLAIPGTTTLATWSDTPGLRDDLAATGFVLETAPGSAAQGELTAARYAPAFAPRRSPGRKPAAVQPAERRALIIGAGIAGACAAASLQRLGWRCTVLDRNPAPAAEASGNPGGLFHGTVHAADGPHARFNRAAALLAASRYRPLIASGRVPGQADGLLRLQPGGAPSWLPTDYVRLVRGAELAGTQGRNARDADSAWLYPAAGWVAPAELVRELLRDPAIDFRGGVLVDRIERTGGGWLVRGVAGEVLGSAPVVVLAGAQGNQGLMHSLGHPGWPTQLSRGQITWFESAQQLPLPMAGNGYALTLPGGELLCGATTHEGDLDAAPRQSDHAHNLGRLQVLTGIDAAPGATLQGRVGWRSQPVDRLPIVGAVALASTDISPDTRLDQARLVPRLPGLFVLGALGSRGLTWGPLAGDVLAAWIDGAPSPIEADLLDAIDPARWLVRAARASAA